MPFDTGYLTTIGKVDVIIDLGARPNFADIQATVTFLNGLVVRGENARLRRARQCLLLTLTGCLSR